MAASTSHDLWLCYQQCMDLHRQAQDPHTRNLMLADAQACLGLWFNAVERELRAATAAAADPARQPELNQG
jgi:hypothetical protein